MGEMADLAYEGVHLERDTIDSWLTYPDKYLVEITSPARLPKVCSIRRYFFERGELSQRQRYVLANWLLCHAREM